MNHADLKNYAPLARRDFIQAVTDRAAFYGVTATKIEPVTQKGDVAIIAGHAFPVSVVAKRKKLESRIKRYGFNQTMEALAYTWFNRFVAIRFMEIHGYLEHGYRVLSHPDPTKTIPEILELAEHVEIPGLSREKVIDLKLEGNKESELYRMLLLAQCHALHSDMPFLFEGIDDETELVLPENLLHSDSIIRKLVAASDPKDWYEVEVLGWLYQFYISERKDEVTARKTAVPTEDIPAVTQLFTPHWIVCYLVENSLGRLWLLNRPGSRLREHMPYYIEGEVETDFLKITKPEEIRLLDPACGSGHMLTYAFDLLFLIYEEEGYVPSQIPALILRHNLYGLEICPRAAQIANLALVFKAREKSPRFIQSGNLVQPHILALQNVHFDDRELSDYIAALDLGGLFNQPMFDLLHQFEEATTFGSLIQPCLNETGIAYARGAIEAKDLGGKLFLRETHIKVLRVLEQAEMMCQRYHVVVANPPYMTGGMNEQLSKLVTEAFRTSRSDLSATFISRSRQFCVPRGLCALVTMHSWMFLTTLVDFRKDLLSSCSILNLAHHGIGAFPTLNSKVVQTVAFVLNLSQPKLDHIPICFRLLDYDPEVKERQLRNREKRFATLKQTDFFKIEGMPLAYWISEAILESFQQSPIRERFALKEGLGTRNDPRFLRCFWEVSCNRTGSGRAINAKWLRTDKAGAARKWFGNLYWIMNWENDGFEIKNYRNPDGSLKSRPQNTQFFFREAVTWGKVGTIAKTFRYRDSSLAFNDAAPSAFGEDLHYLLALLNCRVFESLLDIQGDTMNVTLGVVGILPFISRDGEKDRIVASSLECVSLARADWDNSETSWDFRDLPLLRAGTKGATLETSWRNWLAQSTAAIHRMQELETENNRLFIEAYSLADELKPEVAEEQITLARADACKNMAAFLSYAVGCMMGRYSLDKPGLILADAGDSLVEFSAKVIKPLNSLSFSPDEDGIIPVLDGEWFENDIVTRTRDFLRATFGEVTLEANVRFIEESVGKGLSKYFLTEFYKDHLQTYKKRPIYWLFSSGRERAFQALVYLHRYHEGTLSRIRTEYVIPLQGKIQSRIDQLADDIQKATSTSHRKKMEKERDTLLKQRTELQAFDEKLRHYADQRIQLDLDDGVKVNYGKFGDLLAEVKAVTGGSED